MLCHCLWHLVLYVDSLIYVAILKASSIKFFYFLKNVNFLSIFQSFYFLLHENKSLLETKQPMLKIFYPFLICLGLMWILCAEFSFLLFVICSKPQEIAWLKRLHVLLRYSHNEKWVESTRTPTTNNNNASNLFIATSSFSFGFTLFGVATARKHFPFLPIKFVSLLSSNLFHVFSCQIHPPSPWPSSFLFTWQHHLHHPFSR